MITYILLGFYLISVVSSSFGRACELISYNICPIDTYLTNYIRQNDNYLFNQTNSFQKLEVNEYTFPFNTCEKVSDGIIAQPYSALINIINSFVILNFLFKTKTIHSFFFIFSILCFELFHTFSHIIHIQGPIQINIIHSISYLINFCLLNLFINYTKLFPNYKYILYITALVILDIYFFINYSIIYYLSTQSIIFVSQLFYYYKLLPNYFKKNLYSLIFANILIITLFINETSNCKKMLLFNLYIPYHGILEIAGIFYFYIVCKSFFKLI
jgi:hypothetical protein